MRWHFIQLPVGQFAVEMPPVNMGGIRDYFTFSIGIQI